MMFVLTQQMTLRCIDVCVWHKTVFFFIRRRAVKKIMAQTRKSEAIKILIHNTNDCLLLPQTIFEGAHCVARITMAEEKEMI